MSGFDWGTEWDGRCAFYDGCDCDCTWDKRIRVDNQMREVRNHKGDPFIEGVECRGLVPQPDGSWDHCGCEKHWIGVRVISDGRRVLSAQCVRCQHVWGSFSTKQMCTDPICRSEEIRGVFRDSSTDAPKCMYAGCQEPAQRHHYAPKSVFGQEAYLYGTVPLCIEHHRAWHLTMDRADAVRRAA